MPLAAIAFFLAAMITAAADAQQMRFVCSEPQGKRVDYGDVIALDGRVLQRFSAGPSWSDDGFINVRPTVIISGQEMFITWANAAPNDLSEQVSPKQVAKRIPITGRDDLSVFGSVANLSTTETYRFYFNYRTLLLLTSSVSLVLQDRSTTPAMAAIYISRCELF